MDNRKSLVESHQQLAQQALHQSLVIPLILPLSWLGFSRAVKELVSCQDILVSRGAGSGWINSLSLIFAKKLHTMNDVTMQKHSRQELETEGVFTWPIWEKEASRFDWY